MLNFTQWPVVQTKSHKCRGGEVAVSPAPETLPGRAESSPLHLQTRSVPISSSESAYHTTHGISNTMANSWSWTLASSPQRRSGGERPLSLYWTWNQWVWWREAGVELTRLLLPGRKKEPQDPCKLCPARGALHLNEEGTPAANTQARCQADSALPQHLSCLKTQGIKRHKGITNAFIDPDARTLDLPLIKPISITRAAPRHSNTPPGSLSPPYRVCSSPSHPR